MAGITKSSPWDYDRNDHKGLDPDGTKGTSQGKELDPSAAGGTSKRITTGPHEGQPASSQLARIADRTEAEPTEEPE